MNDDGLNMEQLFQRKECTCNKTKEEDGKEGRLVMSGYGPGWIVDGWIWMEMNKVTTEYNKQRTHKPNAKCERNKV
jgi:hypothetical protein